MFWNEVKFLLIIITFEDDVKDPSISPQRKKP